MANKKTNPNKDRYDHIPISEATKKGMSLNIDDLAAVGRMLSLQDNAYDEQFEGLEKLMKRQAQSIDSLLDVVKELHSEVKALREEVGDIKRQVAGLEKKIGEITKKVDVTQKEVGGLVIDVKRLKVINSFQYYALRVAVAVVITLSIVRFCYGPFI